MVVKSCRYSTGLGVPFIVTAGVDRWKVLGSMFIDIWDNKGKEYCHTLFLRR